MSEKLEKIGPLLDVDLNTEGNRFEAREAAGAVARSWFAKHTLSETETALKDAGVLVGGLLPFEELVESDLRCSLENQLFAEIDQPGLGRVLEPRVPLQFGGMPVPDVAAAPRLVEDTDRMICNTTEQIK